MNPAISRAPRASVIIATYNRAQLLERLLDQLADQSLPRDDFEVIVVDDGSREPVQPRLRPRPYALRVEEQPNSGPGAARDRGASTATGDILVFVDDDMQVGRDFLQAHLAMHPPGSQRAVLGHIRSPPQPGDMALHERWHQHHLDRLAARSRLGASLPGTALYTGNLSLRRSLYRSVGGFDLSFRHLEDGEFGLRLEKSGVEIVVGEAAFTLNNGDRPPASTWRRRVHTWGSHGVRIARKHPDLPQASPWHLVDEMHPALRAIPLAALFLPGGAGLIATATYAMARAADVVGLKRFALSAVGLTYTLEYFRGVRDAIGSASGVAAELRARSRPSSPGRKDPGNP